MARSPYGFMVQVLGGLITYLLLAIYCHSIPRKESASTESENYALTSQMRLGFWIITPRTFGGKEITPMQKPNRTVLGQTGFYSARLQEFKPLSGLAGAVFLPERGPGGRKPLRAILKKPLKIEPIENPVPK